MLSGFFTSLLELSPLLGERFGLAANVGPLNREIENCSWRLAVLEQPERGEHDPALQIAVERGSKVVAHRPGKKQCARNLDGLRNVACHGDGNGRDTTRFDGSLDQSDGLMTDRSSWG